MAAHGEPVVGGVDNVGVFSVGCSFQRFHDPANLLVEVSDKAVVFAELIADNLLGPWPGGEAFVATGCCLRNVLEGVL